MIRKNKYDKKNITFWLHFIFWVVIGFSHVMVFGVFFEDQMVIPRALVNMAFLAFLFYFNTGVLVEKFLEKKQYVTFGVTATVLILIFIPIRTFVNLQFPIPNIDITPEKAKNGYSLVAFATNLGIVLFSTLYQILVNRVAEERKNLEAINKTNEARLQLLRAQINPHFLFNTLNNIYSLAVVQSEKTAGMVLKLSHLLRYVIYESQSAHVPLKKEFEQIDEFIELFQIKSENKLNIVFEKKWNEDNAMIEPMVLIPLVENCFKHCDFDLNPEAHVKIYAEVKEDSLFFKTINSKNDNNQQKDKVGGVGLKNIKNRLALKEDEDWKLEIKNLEKEFITECTLKLIYE